MTNIPKNKNSSLEEVMSYEKDQELNSSLDNSQPDPEVAKRIEVMDHIIKSSCGKNEDGTPNAAITIAVDEYSFPKNTARSVLNYSSYKPIINIQKHYEFIQIDLCFASKVDNDMKVIWNHVEKFGQMLDNVNAETDDIPFLTLTIVPIEEQGRYYITATNPIFWCLQPTKPGADSSVLRILFRTENVGFYETDEIDSYEVEANVQRSVVEHERVAESYERAEEEAARIAEEKNKKLEELRRNGM